MDDPNPTVLDLVAAYEAGGHGGHRWPSAPGTTGTTRDLVFDGVTVARGGRGTHCVGITYEVFVTAAAQRGVALDARAAKALLREWFVPEKGGAGSAAALVASGLGARVEPWWEARPGDFVQFWTEAGWGHSAIVLGWTSDARGHLDGLRYWSSQPWTGGIGETWHPVGPHAGDVWTTSIDPERIYVARAL